MRNYLFCGDTHGYLDFAQLVAVFAAENDAEIIQVGDFGYLWPGADKLQALSDILKRAGEFCAKPPVVMRAIDGNHDDHVRLRQKVNAAYCDGDGELPGGGVRIAEGVIYQPRGSTHVDEDGTRFLFVGGAPSIDRALRTPGQSWWPEEVLTEDEFEASMNVRDDIHVLVTHDTFAFPPGYGPKGSPWHRAENALSFERIGKLIDYHEPELHVHGHWHEWVDRRRGATRSVGLDSNYAKNFDCAVLLWSREVPDGK